jgi:branched-subunit amino acid aminotransferase/4-amino-4-deoxychorismate lyase
MRNLGYYNGEIGFIEDMKVPMTDRGLYFGDGIYDAAYSRNYIIYALDEHIIRFYNNLTRRIREALEGGYFEEFYQKYHIALGERSQD